MNKKQAIFIVFLTSLFLIKLAISQSASSEFPLRFNKWLEEEVTYIISPIEKQIFLKLQSDRERELFIEAFWNQRNPNPGSTDNEFKKEHYRRFNYANQVLGRGTSTPGWQTDRGRIYILLGEPRHIERITGDSQIFDTEVWFYQGLTQYGLPPGFNIIFYRRGGAGDYVLYSPTGDGPQALLVSSYGGSMNYQDAYANLRKINYNLAQASLSLIPGETLYSGQPSLGSDILLLNIAKVPQKSIKEEYAEKFILYKDRVEVEYSTHYIENDSFVRVLYDSSGMPFVHYLVEIKRFSVEQGDDNKYKCQLMINGRITDREEKTIYQFEFPVPVELTEERMKSVAYSPFDFSDIFPLVPGDYKFSLILKNEISKEFTTFEKDITVYDYRFFPRLGPLILGYQMASPVNNSTSLKPFQIGGSQIFCEPNRIFLPKDRLFLGFQILGLDSGRKKNLSVRYDFLKANEISFSLTKKVSEYADQSNVFEAFPLLDFKPDRYQLKVTILDEGKELFRETEEFEITPAARLPRPWVHYRTLLPSIDPSYLLILGTQYYKKGALEKAKTLLEQGARLSPRSQDFAIPLAMVYLELKKYREMEGLLQPLRDSAQPAYEVLYLLGKSFEGQGDFTQAIDCYQRAQSSFGVNAELLNALGECYYGLKLWERAEEMWEKSLEIYPGQPAIQKRVEELKKRKKEIAFY